MGQNISEDRSWNKYSHSQHLSSAEIAEQLIGNGFCPIPVKAKTKKPAFNDWPTRAFQPSDFKNSCSVGLKTGNGLIGLDIDHYDPIVVQQIRNEAEKRFGVGLARIGQPPKILLLYRCDFITKKQTLKLAPSGKAPEGKSEALEILSKGQQAVVSGIHPETNAPYFWETVEPWDIAAGQLDRLPQIRENEWTAFLAHVQETFGQTLKTTSKHDIKQSLNLNSSGDEHRAENFHSNHETSLEEVKEILSYIDPSCDYDTWLAVTMGVKSLGEQFYGTWLSWSSKGTNHEPNVDPRKWYEVSTVGGISFGTVCQMAREGGADLSEIAKKHKSKNNTENKSDTKDDEVPSRTFEELLAAARTISKDDNEGIEQIIAETLKINSIKRETIFSALKDNTGYTLTAMRKQRSELFKETPSLDQLDLAKKTISGLGADNILHSSGLTWLWGDVGVWKTMEDRTIKQSAQKVIEDEKMDVTAHLVNGVCDVLKSEINDPKQQFNLGNLETVNCPNGQLELDDGIWQLKPHKKDEYRTTQIPVVYDNAATAPKFLQFMSEIFCSDPDKDDKVECILQMMGYTLMSHSQREKFIMLIGNGANGKSVFLAVLEAVCGTENIAGVQPSQFDRTFQRAELHNKLANIVTELSEGEKLADAELKSITSGEPVTVERKYKDPFVMRPYSTCWFGTNHMPKTSDFSEALFRRAVIITFNRTFQPHEQNTNLKNELIQELPGILNLALNAYARAISDGFTIPSSATEASKEWKTETDQVAEFVAEDCMTIAEGVTPTATLHDRYLKWCSLNQMRDVLTIKSFSTRMKKLGYQSSKSGSVRNFRGIALKL